MTALTSKRIVSIGVLVVLAAAGVAATTGAGAAGSGGGDWTTYGGNFERTAYQPLSPSLTSIRALWTESHISGEVYGEPLIYDGNVYVGTENDVVYELSARTGRIRWKRTLGAPVNAGTLPCGDIHPTLGITSTMVIDTSRNELFASAAVDLGGAYHHLLFGLNLANGSIEFRRDIDLPGWTANAQLQRVALGIDDGNVLVGFGGNWGDCAQYRGYLLGIPESGSSPLLEYAIPTARAGAIWAPDGETVEPSGRILFATGNSASSTTYDEGDSVVELTATFHRLGYFAPTDWRIDNADDLDLGSSAPVLVPGNQVLIAGKQGIAFLLSASHLGGIGGEVSETGRCNVLGGVAVYGADVFLACPDATMMAVRVRPRSVRPLWTTSAPAAGSPTVAGKLVWSVSNGSLIGLAPDSGREVVTGPVIPTEHFAAPSAGEGLLVVGGDSAVEAFVGSSGYLGP